VNPLDLDIIDDVTGHAPPHNVTDPDKVQDLVASMREDYADLEETLVALIAELPADVRDAYGLDMH
jgi:hypothetical protein